MFGLAQLGQAEVQHLDHVFTGLPLDDQNVLRLEVPVNDADPMRLGERAAHLNDDFRCALDAERPRVAVLREHFDLRPKGIVQMLDLLRPIYLKTAAYGHFGRNEPEFTWEKTDKAAALAADAGARKTA